MKVQFRDRGLRIRIDEAELATLLDGEPVTLAVDLAGAPILTLQLALGEHLGCTATPRVRITLPRAEVEAYARTLPCREGLGFELDATLMLELEVDVRDSVRIRGPRRRAS